MANSLYLHGQGKAYTITLQEMSKPKKIDNRTGEEVAVDVINKIGLRLE